MDLSSTVLTAQETEAQHFESLVSELTYAKWIKAGKRPNDFDRFWEEAEREVAQQLSRAHGPPAAAPPKKG